MRTLALHNPLAHGADVIKLQELLQHRLLFFGVVDGVFGPYTASCCVTAKKHYHYPKHLQTPTAGETLIHILTTNKSPYHHFPVPHPNPNPQTREDTIRSKILEYVIWGINHSPEIHYAETRPMDHLDELQILPQTNDCSEFATKAYKFAGAADPNGNGYNGLGYTGTMMNHCRHITREMVKPGDLVIYGRYPGHHVAVALEDGKSTDIDTCSHGNEHGPYRIRVSQEVRYQPSSIVQYFTGF